MMYNFVGTSFSNQINKSAAIRDHLHCYKESLYQDYFTCSYEKGPAGSFNVHIWDIDTYLRV